MLIPLYPYIVRHHLPTTPTPGTYTGLLGSAFYMPLFVMNVVWGAASDRVGRKPVLVAGLVVSVATSLAVGLSPAYGVTVGARVVAGVFGAGSTVAKGMLGDIAGGSDTDRAWAFAMYGAMYGMSGILGPVLGGMLADPGRLYPAVFGRFAWATAYPFLLPCLLGAALACVACVTTLLLLEETPKRNVSNGSGSSGRRRGSIADVVVTAASTALSGLGRGASAAYAPLSGDMADDPPEPRAGPSVRGRVHGSRRPGAHGSMTIHPDSTSSDSVALEDLSESSQSLYNTNRLQSSRASTKPQPSTDPSSAAAVAMPSASVVSYPPPPNALDNPSTTSSRRRLFQDDASASVSSLASASTQPLQPSPHLPRQHQQPFNPLALQTLGPVLLYCAIAYTNITYMTSLPLYFSTDRPSGGLALSARDTSFFLTLISASKLATQLTVFQRLLGAVGSRGAYHLGMALFIPAHAVIPFIAGISPVGSGSVAVALVTSIVMVALGVAEAVSYLSVLILITQESDPRSLGLAHGFASTMAASMRTIGPAAAGALWEWGITLGMSWLVFFLGGAVALGASIASS
ncbi:major facilitator superfamily domain-containing protein [Entophlyctis helioformis]|nr:major facilitator superfamily domain-containing protein [Entophlyctis helioformis]